MGRLFGSFEKQRNYNNLDYQNHNSHTPLPHPLLIFTNLFSSESKKLQKSDRNLVVILTVEPRGLPGIPRFVNLRGAFDMTLNEIKTVSTASDHQIIKIKEVMELTAISRSQIYRLASMGKFPRSISLVPGGTSVGWLKSEILNFIQDRVLAREELCS